MRMVFVTGRERSEYPSVELSATVGADPEKFFESEARSCGSSELV